LTAPQAAGYVYTENISHTWKSVTTTDSTIKTARRIFEVLEYFEDVRRPISLKELSHRYDYPASSAAALLKSMVVMGYLFYDRYNRTYMPTMRLAQIGGWLNSGLFGESAILALVEYVHRELDELTTIGTQSDLHAQYIHCLQTRKRLRFEVRPGDIRPLAMSGIGLAILSAHTDVEIARLLRRINATHPSAERIRVEGVMKVINSIRRDGYVFNKHTVTQDAGVIAMPLPGRNFGRVLVLGVAGPVSRLEDSQDQIVDCMKKGIARFVRD
jgi:DNA-binding IclR family transcriptional regulator